jgi:hypothetical protein
MFPANLATVSIKTAGEIQQYTACALLVSSTLSYSIMRYFAPTLLLLATLFSAGYAQSEYTFGGNLNI